MSIKSAQAFIERIQNDEDFRKELEERASEEERMKFAKARGFDFTKDEIDELKAIIPDGELEMSGGVSDALKLSTCMFMSVGQFIK